MVILRYGLLCLLIGGCNFHTKGTVSTDPVGPGQDGSIEDRSIETFATPLVVEAGADVLVSCVVRRGGQYLPGEPTRVEVHPDPGNVARVVGGWQFNLTTAGLYVVNCHSVDGALYDQNGVQLEVKPGQAAAIETQLETSSSQAGLPVMVTCAVEDSYGNTLVGTRGAAILADESISLDPPSGVGFPIRGTLAGEHSIACRLGEIVDQTPEVLTITPGPPGVTETKVNLSELRPATLAMVTCTVGDGFGNTLPDIPTEVSIMVADGTSNSEAGVVLADHTFSAKKAGIYYVFCKVAGFKAGDETPAEVRIKWGLPCTWTCSLPEQDCYWQGRRLPLACEVSDFWGNEVKDAALRLTASPSIGVVNDGPGSWIFNREGDFDLSLSVPGPYEDELCSALPGYAGLPATFDIRVDSTGPKFDILSPAQASQFSQGSTSDMLLTITGNLTDSLSPIVSANLGGVSLGANGVLKSLPINVARISRWGLNTLPGLAEDECGNRTILAQSYVRSGDFVSSRYFTPATVPNAGARAASGLVIHINQSLFDDGNRTDLDDMATIAERILKNQDFNKLVPAGHDFAANDATRPCSALGDNWIEIEYVVERHPDPARQITWVGPSVAYMRAVDGGMEMDARIDDFSFPVRLWAQEVHCVLGNGPSAWVDADMDVTLGADRIQAAGMMAIALSGTSPQVSAPNVQTTISGLALPITCASWLQWLCDWIWDGLQPLVANLVQNRLESAIAQQVPPLVAGFLSGFKLDSGFDVPAPLSLRLNMSSALDRLIFCGPNVGVAEPAECEGVNLAYRYAQLGLYTQIYPSFKDSDIPSNAPGAIRKSGSLPVFSTSAYPFGIGLKDDLLNQMLWAVWYGGGLDLDASDLQSLLSSTGFTGIKMALFAKLPPVLMPGRSGWEIQIGLGDVRVDAEVDLEDLLDLPGAGSLNLSMYLSTTIGGSVDLNPTTNVLTLDLESEPEVFVDVFDIDDPGYQATLSEIFSQILQIILPQLLSRIVTSFPLPDLDLRSLANLPIGTPVVWSLHNGTISRSTNYYRLTGSLY